MNYGKYIIVKERGHEVAVAFNPLIEHSAFSHLFRDNIVSAGFFRVEADFDEVLITFTIKIVVFGESVSLELKPREKDVALIEEILRK